MRLHSDVLPDVLVRHTRLPRPRVEQVIRQAKARGRISAGRPFAPPLTARDIARLILALSATSSGSAVEHEREVGRLPLTEGSGLAAAEDAVIAIVGATGAADGAFVRVGQTIPSLQLLSATGAPLASYGGTAHTGAASYFEIPTMTVCAIARELLQ